MFDRTEHHKGILSPLIHCHDHKENKATMEDRQCVVWPEQAHDRTRSSTGYALLKGSKSWYIIPLSHSSLSFYFTHSATTLSNHSKRHRKHQNQSTDRPTSSEQAQASKHTQAILPSQLPNPSQGKREDQKHRQDVHPLPSPMPLRTHARAGHAVPAVAPQHPLQRA